MNIFQFGRVPAVATAVALVVVAPSGVASAMDRPPSSRDHVSHGSNQREGAGHALRVEQTHQSREAGVRAAKVQAYAVAEALRKGVPPDATDAGFTPASPRNVEQALHQMADHEVMAVIATQMQAGRPHDVQVLIPLPDENGQVVYHSTTTGGRFSGLELDGYHAAYAALTPEQRQALPSDQRARYKTGPQYRLFYKISEISALPSDSPVSPVGAQTNRSLPTYIQNWITYKPNTVKGKILKYLYLGAGRDKGEFTADDLIEAGVIAAGQRRTAVNVLISMEKSHYLTVAQAGKGAVAARYEPLSDGELATVSTASRIDRFLQKYGYTVPGKILRYLKDRPGQKFSEADLIAAGLFPNTEHSNSDIADLVGDGLVATEKIKTEGPGRKPVLYQIASGS